MDKILELISRIMGEIAFLRTLFLKMQTPAEEPTITVLWDEPITVNDLCVSGKKGGDTMPPRYADGTFRQRGNILEYRFTHLKNQISVYGRTETECFDKRTAHIMAPAAKEKKKNIKTLEGWLTEWFDTYKAPYNGTASQKDIKRRIRYAIEFFGKNKPLSDITGIEIQKLLNKYADRPESQDKLLDVLNAAFEKAYICQIIKQNPCGAAIKTPYKPKTRVGLDFDAQQRVWNAISNEKYKKLFFFACCTGIRIGRILELTVDNINHEKQFITVFKKQRRGLTETYDVPFLPELWDTVPLMASGKLFPDITYNGAKCYFENLYRGLKIKGSLLHTFRHTFISTCYYCGIDIKKLQIWAGHATIDITLDIYTHLMENGNSNILEYIKMLVAGK